MIKRPWDWREGEESGAMGKGGGEGKGKGGGHKSACMYPCITNTMYAYYLVVILVCTVSMNLYLFNLSQNVYPYGLTTSLEIFAGMHVQQDIFHNCKL